MQINGKPKDPRDGVPDLGVHSSGGQDHRGHFTAGNKFGKGGPIAAAAYNLKRAMMEAITGKDIRLATQKMLDYATGAESGIHPTVRIAAFKLILDAINGTKTDNVDVQPVDDTNEFIRDQVREILANPIVAEAIAEETLR